MCLKLRTIISTKILSFAALASISIYACKESKDSIASSGKASVSINLLGVETPLLTTKKASNGSSSTTSNQTIVVPLSKTSSFEATLTNESSAASGSLLRASSGSRAAVTEERTPLGNNVKYKVVIYNSNGDYVTEKTYTNTVDNSSEITLDAGQAYTFVAYSVNSTSSVPSVTAQTALTTATLDNIGADLVYFKGNLTVQSGDNNLDVVLKHQYSQVTTNLSMATEMTGAITNLGTTTINPTHLSASLKLADGTITYNGSTTTTNVVFPSLGASGLRTVSSTPTLLIHPGATNGVFNFGTITIDGETNNNVSVAGLNIVPGQRYNLNLNFKTCTQTVTGGSDLNWTYTASGSGAIVDGVPRQAGYVVTKTLAAPGADYGFVFDIQQLDNSFNMEVNGQKLATQEIQFEAGIGIAPRNVQFEDGSLYGGTNTEGGTVPQVYNLTGTSTKPLVRVVISRTGEVSMYGSKSNGGELYPLVLTQGSFNNVPWSSTTNTVIITQIVQGATKMVGSGSGRKKIACP